MLSGCGILHGFAVTEPVIASALRSRKGDNLKSCGGGRSFRPHRVKGSAFAENDLAISG